MHLRETRDFAREIKFVTTIDRHAQLVEWSRANLAPDEHGTGAHGDHYDTCSLYFETPRFDVYSRNGSYGKSKYRIRRYGLSNVVFLERKFRTERLLSKRRTIVPVSDLERLAGDSPDAAWLGYWFHRRVQLRGLQPLIQLSYERIARIGPSSTGPVRMTIDTGLQVLPMPDLTFLAGIGMPFLENTCIVEVKYRVQLPALFRSFAEEFHLQPQKISKFRSGLLALDYPVPREDDQETPDTPGLTDSESSALGHWD